MQRHLVVFVIAATSCTAQVSGEPFVAGEGGDGPVAQQSADDGPGADVAEAPDDAVTPDPGDGTSGPPHADADHPVPGAFWANVTHELAAITDSECGNAASVFSNPWADMVITGIARHGMYATTDGGESWQPLGAAGGDTIRHRMAFVLFDPEHEGTWWEAGIYGFEDPWSAGVARTTNNGASFAAYDAMGPQNQSHNDSVSVDFGDPQRRTILSGGHEQGVTGPTPQGLFLSHDAGASFDDIMSRLPAGLGFCTSTLVVNADVLLVGCANSWAGQTPAIVRSTDAGVHWTIVSNAAGSGQPLRASDGAIYWATNTSMMKSDDDGATFIEVSRAGERTGELPPIELPDGRIASVGDRRVVVSGDGGSTWHAVTDTIPFLPNGFTYSPFRRAFFASHFDCTSVVPNDAYARFGWDYEAK